MNEPLTAAKLVLLGRYNWIGQPERLIYVGRYRGWYQFVLVEEPGKCWCEVLAEDLHRLEQSQ